MAQRIDELPNYEVVVADLVDQLQRYRTASEALSTAAEQTADAQARTASVGKMAEAILAETHAVVGQIQTLEVARLLEDLQRSYESFRSALHRQGEDLTRSIQRQQAELSQKGDVLLTGIQEQTTPLTQALWEAVHEGRFAEQVRTQVGPELTAITRALEAHRVEVQQTGQQLSGLVEREMLPLREATEGGKLAEQVRNEVTPSLEVMDDRLRRLEESVRALSTQVGKAKEASTTGSTAAGAAREAAAQVVPNVVQQVGQPMLKGLGRTSRAVYVMLVLNVVLVAMLAVALGGNASILSDDGGAAAAGGTPTEKANSTTSSQVKTAVTATTSVATTPAPTRTSKPEPTSTPARTPTPDRDLTGPAIVSSSTGDRDCADFDTQREAQAYFQEKGGDRNHDVDDLDGNGDGKVCQNLP